MRIDVVSILDFWGVPGAVMALLLWYYNEKKLEKRFKQRDSEMAAKEAAQKEFWLLLVQSNNAAISLAEATAKAMQRIHEANCNGDMKAALAYSTEIKHKQKEISCETGYPVPVRLEVIGWALDTGDTADMIHINMDKQKWAKERRKS